MASSKSKSRKVISVKDAKGKTHRVIAGSKADQKYAAQRGATVTPTPVKSTPTTSKSAPKPVAPKSGLSIITDPVTKQSYSRDINDPNSTYKPYVAAATAPAIPVAQVNNNAKLTVPKASAFDSAYAAVESVKPLLPSSKAVSQAQQGVDLGYKRLDDYYSKLATKGKKSEQVYKQYAIPQNTKKLQEMNLQIAQKTGEFEKLAAGLEGRGKGIPLSVVTGQQGAVRRQQAAEISALTAVAQAMEGNINLSTQLADRAVSLEFEDIETDIQRTKLFIDQNRDKMSAAQKEQADQLNLYLDSYEEEVATRKADRKDILSFAAEVAAEGFGAVAQQILAAPTLDAAFALAAPYIGRLDRMERGGNADSVISGGYVAPPPQVSKDAISQAKAALVASRNIGAEADGKYADPNVYEQLWQNWKTAGGDLASFLATFPPEDYINPANKTIRPEFRNRVDDDEGWF